MNSLMNEEAGGENLFSNDSHKLYRMSDYIILNKLGSGTYGQVYLAKNKQNQYLYAIKKLKIDQGVPKQTLREISLLRILQHPNIITLYQVLLTGKRCYMVIEYMKLSLYQFIKEYDMPAQLSKSFMYQLLQAILFCHNRGVLHRDIKPHNILVSHTMKVVKLVDFGLARKVEYSMLPLTPVVVTLFYRSPELLLNVREYCSGIDIWAMGCVFAEMALKQAPFRGIEENAELDILFSCFSQLGIPTEDDLPGVGAKLSMLELPTGGTPGPITTLRKIVEPHLFNLIMRMFTYNPYRRINASEALSHEFFSDFDPAIVPAINEESFGGYGAQN